jgi:hypothetical protein
MKKKVISASRRTDLVAFFPKDLSRVLEEEKAFVLGPSGHTYTVDLSPDRVHTIVLWSKNFENLIENRFNLRKRLEKYGQLYFHFTVTGLGCTFLESGVPLPEKALLQLEPLLRVAGRPERISVRFDPIIRWTDEGRIKTNLYFFQDLASALASKGIRTVRFSFAQWYRKSKRRAEKAGFFYLDPSREEKKKDAAVLVSIAQAHGIRLYSCSQNFLTEVDGVLPSSCIDGALLQRFHPLGEEASTIKDKSQRPECGCTESVDIGSYTQTCPHCCLYCYANPKL